MFVVYMTYPPVKEGKDQDSRNGLPGRPKNTLSIKVS